MIDSMQILYNYAKYNMKKQCFSNLYKKSGLHARCYKITKTESSANRLLKRATVFLLKSSARFSWKPATYHHKTPACVSCQLSITGVTLIHPGEERQTFPVMTRIHVIDLSQRGFV